MRVVPHLPRPTPLLTAALCVSLVIIGPFSAHPAIAADTTEVFAPGALDVELYNGADLIRRGDESLFSNTVLGFGLSPRISPRFFWTLSSGDALRTADRELGGGLFMSVFESPHIDLDLSLDLSADGNKLDMLTLAPGFELNYDSHPDMRGWGAYLRGALLLSDHESFSLTHLNRHHMWNERHSELTLGAYLMLTDDKQLLIEHDLQVRMQTSDSAPPVGIGGLALGYNQVLNDTAELIAQFYVDLPQGEERVGFGASVGLLLTLPAMKRESSSLGNHWRSTIDEA